MTNAGVCMSLISIPILAGILNPTSYFSKFIKFSNTINNDSSIINKFVLSIYHLTIFGLNMKFLHTMIRVTNIEESLDFFCNKLGLVEIRRKDVPEGKFTLIFLAATEDEKNANETRSPEIELTYNWEPEKYDNGRNFGHLALSVKNIYETCQKLMDKGVTINRPPREGRMAFIKSPDNISIELLQQGNNLEIKEPWSSMKNIGTW